MIELLLQKEIQEKGPLPQSRFMELALQHPLYGYYRSQIGVGRDFITSPEISQVFGELIGAWAIDCYVKLSQPKALSLIELGPGKGTLMADLLRITKHSQSFFEALKIYLVEINPLLKEIQEKTIPYPLTWVECFKDIPVSSDPWIIIGNEFFDVLPINTYMRKNNFIYERYIDFREDKFSFTWKPLCPNEGPDGLWEESFHAEALMQEICIRLLKQRGVFLCIDYGYEKGKGESLQALFEGARADPLQHIGKSDLTCHVNFSRLKEIALSQGLEVLGPIPQGQFLKNCGLDIRIEILKHKNPSQRASLSMAADRLTHPQQMGTLFKVMAVFSPASLLPIGFKS